MYARKWRSSKLRYSEWPIFAWKDEKSSTLDVDLVYLGKDDPQFAEPIENAMNAVWAKVYSELSNG